MDKRAKQGKKVDRSSINRSSEPPKFKVRMAPERVPEYQAIISDITQEYGRLSAELSKALKAFFPINKSVLEIAKWLQDTDFSNSINFWTTAFALDFIETRLSNIETIVQGIAQKVNLDIPTLRSKVETLDKTIKEPAIAEVLQFVRTMKKKMEESKRKQEKYVR